MTSVADGGEHVHVARRPVVGADKVARYLLGVLAGQRRLPAEPTASVELVNGRAGVVVRSGGAVTAIVDLSVTDRRITRIFLQVDPLKLSAWSPEAGHVQAPPVSDALWARLTPRTMRAVQVTRSGGPEVLDVVDVPEPEAGTDQKVSAVSTAGVTYADTHHALSIT